MPVNSVVDKFFKKILGTNSERFLKAATPTIQEINNLEASVKKLSDDQLRAKTDEFKQRIQTAVEEIEDKAERRKREQEILNQILPEAFAVVREASVRVT